MSMEVSVKEIGNRIETRGERLLAIMKDPRTKTQEKVRAAQDLYEFLSVEVPHLLEHYQKAIEKIHKNRGGKLPS